MVLVQSIPLYDSLRNAKTSIPLKENIRDRTRILDVAVELRDSLGFVFFFLELKLAK